MRIFILLLGFLPIILFSACNRVEKKTNLSRNPQNLRELHSNFLNEELTPKKLDNSNDKITIIATGHIYPLLNYPIAYQAFADSIINQKSDYVFILGDIVKDNTQEEWDQFFKYFTKIREKLFFSPGNHDLNYHYERYFGKRDHQFEAEMRYIKNVGYRYKLVTDNYANYVFVNMNDSIDRILNFLNIISPNIDPDNFTVLLTSQSVWHDKHQDSKDPRTWTEKSFTRDEILPHLKEYDFLIHGDWGGKYFEGKWPKGLGENFSVLAVGNRVIGDSLFITRIEITEDEIKSFPISISVPTESLWFLKKKQ
jgi:predicted phosphodiesterase